MNERMLTIIFIGLTLLGAVGGVIWLSVDGKDATVVAAIATGALGILTPSPLSKNFTPPDPAIPATPQE